MDQRHVIGGCGSDSSVSGDRSVTGARAHDTEPLRSTHKNPENFLT